MCFNQPMSFLLGAFGVALTLITFRQTRNLKLTAGVFWFTLMELLQGFQYMVIDDCDNWWNKALTLFGFLHICLQPFFTHVLFSAYTKNPKYLEEYKVVMRLSLLGGLMVFGRYFLHELWPSAIPVSSDYTIWKNHTPAFGAEKTREWLRGEALCTFSGNYHLSWSVPMYPVSYWIPSGHLHFFLMFVPFFVMADYTLVSSGIKLFLSGPFIALLATDNLMEQASIWCFFSIGVVFLAVFGIVRQTWGLKGSELEKVRSSLSTSLYF